MPHHRPLAVVTGASSGLGREFALRYAERGHDIVVVARRRDRLEALAADVRERFGAAVSVVTADLADPAAPSAIVETLRAQGLRADVLVNCAGFGTAGPFAEEDPARLADEIVVDVLAPALLARLLLPDLLASPRGTLLMVSSTASFQPLPGAAAYAACKAFVTSLTAAIWQETRGSGLRVLALCPGPTETEFFEAAGSDSFKVGSVDTVDEVVDAAFRHLDRGTGPVLTVGLGNRIRALGATLAPRWLTLAVGARLTGSR
ncbi:SDR family NAD(P)-dependent oxidoreductase [Rathayibacter sp. VKM Ac-2803]|uniref:SDR family NAD(P)-dependent oxidoreductase n=1 Tax=Rathayibacter sp. VKM Ac-2803 TaxID=2609256 RepID=UPI00135B9B20|nr:SDR family NAD(P)-dependent oxidoreductase [Rathayibacter sp. VKM Ac-2803]MWV48750.1 SDR family NAD(P)-dependent oxidoreductase [Rathayibacter sp. VKM Ac-2803]